MPSPPESGPEMPELISLSDDPPPPAPRSTLPRSPTASVFAPRSASPGEPAAPRGSPHPLAETAAQGPAAPPDAPARVAAAPPGTPPPTSAAAGTPAALTTGAGAPGLLELIEAGWRAPFAGRAFYENLRARPAPSRAASLGGVLFWLLAAFAVRASLGPFGVMPWSGLLPSQTLALSAAAVLAAAAPGVLALGGMIHCVAVLSGGSGSYARGLQVLCLLAAIAPAAAALSASSWLYAPVGAGLVLLGRAMALLYGAPAVQAGIVLAAATLLAGTAQYQARRALRPWMEAFHAARALTRPLASPAETERAAEPRESGLSLLQQAQALTGGALTPEQARAMEAMLRGAAADAGGGPGEPASSDAATIDLSATGDKTSGMAVYEKAQAVFNDPAAAKGLNAEQQKDFRELQGIMRTVDASIKGGRKLDAGALLNQVQEMMRKNPGPPPQPSPKKRAKKPPRIRVLPPEPEPGL